MHLILWLTFTVLRSSVTHGQLYLAGVPGAGLGDVAVVHGISTHHASPLVLGARHGKDIGVNVLQRLPHMCYLMHVNGCLKSLKM